MSERNNLYLCSTQPHHNGRRAFSVIELLFYSVLLVLLFSAIYVTVQWYRRSQQGIERLATLHELQMAAFRLADELQGGSLILHPPIAANAGEKAHQLMVRNSAHEVAVIYLNDKRELVMLNLMHRERRTVLGRGLEEFSVRRPAKHHVEFTLSAREAKVGGIPDDQRPLYVVGNGVRLRNVLY